jgi:hypothetical protein
MSASADRQAKTHASPPLFFQKREKMETPPLLS